MGMPGLSGRKQGNMPLEAYTSQEWFEWEQDELFGKCWQFAGLSEDVSEPGDYVTAQAGRYESGLKGAPDGEGNAGDWNGLTDDMAPQRLKSRGGGWWSSEASPQCAASIA